MTNPKDEEKPKIKKKNNPEWRKVGTVIKAVATFDKRPPGRRKRRESEPPPAPKSLKKVLVRHRSSGTPQSLAGSDHVTSVHDEPEVPKCRLPAPRPWVSEVYVKEPEADQNDPQAAYRNTVFELIKNTFSLAFGEEGELRINVDNVYPMLKTIGLNPRSESIMDLVRDASMESTGDIDPADFEKVIMNMVRAMDEEIWSKRLEEKEFDRRQKEDERAKDEAEKLRIAQEREKAGFEQAEEEEKDEWAELERQKGEEAKEKKKESEIDELYDNMKMAFRFIDADGDGVISTQDIYNLMMGLGDMLTDDELFGMVNMADLDCDGKVTFDDFKRFLATPEELEALNRTEEVDEAKSQQTTTQTEEQPEVSADKDTAEGTPDVSHSLNDKPTPTNSGIEPGQAKKDDVEANETTTQVAATGPSDEERVRRRKSMLWGYMSSASKLASAMQKPEENTTQEQATAEMPIPEIKEPAEPCDTVSELPVDQVDAADATVQLGAIREEDEHSNYELEEIDRVESKMDTKITSVPENNKRRMFSRQSSSASLKAQGLTGCDSIDDSGIDTINGSEIRDQPDVFELSDDDDGDEDRDVPNESKQPIRRAGSLSTCDIYTTDNEDDEDMVEAYHVHESLSRVSSMETLDDLQDKLPADDDDKERRIRSFVNQHTYVDIRQRPEESQQVSRELELRDVESLTRNEIDEKKMARAHNLEKAILRRSATAPALTVETSRFEKRSTAKPSVNGLTCSHIDIDLTCESPPKADIKSTVLFHNRITSARRNMSRPESARSTKAVSVIDFNGSVGSEGTVSHTADKHRWPVRPLTRPWSPRLRRVQSATSRKSQSGGLEICDLSINVIPKNKTPRARSATPFRSMSAPSLPTSGVRKQPMRQRPQTARPYDTSRTIETPVTRFDKQNSVSVVVTEPFKAPFEPYPRKELLTTYHHGFKSIWPIGRKANLIQNKRPFSAFEMNSYSRSIERSEFPLHISENVSKLKFNANSIRTVPLLSKQHGTLFPETKVIKLELPTTQLEQSSVVRDSSLAVSSTNNIPRPKIVCRFR